MHQTTTFNLTVTATDNGKPFERNSSVMVFIEVKHSNNVNDPTFLQTLYIVYLTEEAPIGTFVANVTATDPDIDQSGVVHYVLLTGGDYFALNRTTGFVTTRCVEWQNVWSAAFILLTSLLFFYLRMLNVQEKLVSQVGFSISFSTIRRAYIVCPLLQPSVRLRGRAPQLHHSCQR